jgi:hypothetical protein
LAAKLPDDILPIEEVFLKIESVFEERFGIARSCFPSPSKSAIVIPNG